MNDDTEYVHEDILFVIVGDHPHTGEHCHPVGHSPETISTLMNDLTLMRLTDCEHGDTGCYVAHENLRILRKRTKGRLPSMVRRD